MSDNNSNNKTVVCKEEFNQFLGDAIIYRQKRVHDLVKNLSNEWEALDHLLNKKRQIEEEEGLKIKDEVYK